MGGGCSLPSPRSHPAGGALPTGEAFEGRSCLLPLMITASLSPVGSHTMAWTSPPILEAAQGHS